MTPFEQAFEYTVGNEGSYSNDKYDSGGPTKFGITIGDLSRWMGRPATTQEVKDMPLETARAIYEARYWKPLGCPGMKNTAMAICMFDIGVVRGIGVPPKYAQEVCNEWLTQANMKLLTVDGHIGPVSLDIMNRVVSPKFFVQRFSAKAEAGFRAIVLRKPTQIVFIKGWTRRARRLLTLV